MPKVVVAYDLNGFQTPVKKLCKEKHKFTDNPYKEFLPDTTLLISYNDKAENTPEVCVKDARSRFIEAVKEVATENGKDITITSLFVASIEEGQIIKPIKVKA